MIKSSIGPTVSGRWKVEGEDLILDLERVAPPEDRDVPNDDFYWFPCEIGLCFAAGTSRYRIEPAALVPLGEGAAPLRACRLT